MFAKGPQPGYSPKAEALKDFPTLICKGRSACGITGFVVYNVVGGKEFPVASAGTSKQAWEKAHSYLLRETSRKPKKRRRKS